MVSIDISSQQSGQRLHKFLLKYLNDAPASFVYKMLRKKNIVLNDKKAKGDEILNDGDKITLYLSDETLAKFRHENNMKTNLPAVGTHVAATSFLAADKRSEKEKTPAFDTLAVLYQDENILAVHKPVGVLSQKAKADDCSINERIAEYCERFGLLEADTTNTFKPSVCNRLDRNTSGIILAGISLKGSQNLTRILKQRTADKYYYTIVSGHFDKALHHIAYVHKDEKKNMTDVRRQPTEGYVKIETAFETIEATEKYSLLRVKLITGKSHQIRAHLAYLGYPIVGDARYGDKVLNRMLQKEFGLKHQLLHAGKIEIYKDEFFDNLTINDPLPKQFVNVGRALGLRMEI